MTAIVLTSVATVAIGAEEHAALVRRRSSGAVVTFEGVVRDLDEGRGVVAIEYSSHPSAPDVLAEVVAEVVSRTAAEAVAVSHRVGHLEVGEVAFVVAVAGGHREEAFETAMSLVDEVKARLPVWKRQIFTDGSDEWVGSA